MQRKCKKNGSKTVLRMSSTHRWAVSVPLKMSKGVPAVKINGTPDHNSCLRASVACIMKAGSARCPGSLQTHLR
ncbi:hypothetical protein TNCV_1706951 [Trichonephila clavipes]|uniref:Uncharacterized protein n=1 Tax=Trichonephila clavipes TaxID=2585209 RepID=A0A8X6RH35_TRICX|nr:hypothetical protein TNCV_1706951 [Trichonephila clavipes]